MEIDDVELRKRVRELFRYATVGSCVNGVTHDVNNYLGAMMAYAELIGLDENLTEDARGMLNQIVSASEKCSQLINGLTNVARKNISNIGVVDLHRIVQVAVMLRSYEHKVNGVKLDLEMPETLPNMVADPHPLQLALLHLLMNAQDAATDSPEKSIRVRVLQNEHAVEIEIWNSGPAMASIEIDGLLDPFVTTKDGHHLGLGLHAAEDIAKGHGGSLTYHPERGFVFALPLKSPLQKGL